MRSATTLFADAFRPEAQLAVTGGAISIVEGVNRGFQGAGRGSSRDGTVCGLGVTGSLVFAPGTRGTVGSRARWTWRSSIGRSAPQRLGLPPAPYGAPRASRDGRWAAVERPSAADIDIWIVDLTGSAPGSPSHFRRQESRSSLDRPTRSGSSSNPSKTALPDCSGSASMELVWLNG